MIKHCGEKQYKRKWGVAFCVVVYLPPFSLHCIVCGPEFHISGICLRRRYTQAYLPAHKATHHWSKISSFEKKRFAAHPYFTRLGSRVSDFSAGCIIFYASSPFFASFSNHPVHSFVHRFQRSGRNTRSGKLSAHFQSTMFT